MAIAYNPKIVTSGLILHLDAANTKSYPGSGSTWSDLSGNGNNGTINSGEWISDGYLRNVGNISDFFYISVADSTSINSAFTVTTGGWTIEETVWTNSVTYPEADAGSVASNQAYSTGNTGFDWNHGIGNTQFKFGQSSNAASGYEDEVTINLSSPYSDLNSWKLRTMIWDRTNNSVSLYINGILQGSGSTTNTAGTSIYDGGGINFGTLYGWKHYGRRSIIKIYNRVLNFTEVQQNFQAIRGRLRV